jgi:hypothetical protein
MNGECTDRQADKKMGAMRKGHQPRRGLSCRPTWYLLVAVITIFLMAIPASVAAADLPVHPNGTGPQIVNVSIYVVDFNRFDLSAGTVGVDFYLNLKSTSPVSIGDVELMNGMITSTSPVIDTSNEKEYRVVAVLTADPDISRYPFDRDTLPIRIEPKVRNVQEMVFVIDPTTSGLSHEANLPGWKFTDTGSSVENHSYLPGEIPFSRVNFDYGVIRDVTSTVLKFFLPLMLIVIVSLSSLMMKISSRLGLNASMFLAAVLIHWRIADGIPSVTYATFLDIFMIITYVTLVMVLLSGILILKFTESGDRTRVEQINRWSIRIIPALSVTLYFLLFLTLAI